MMLQDLSGICRNGKRYLVELTDFCLEQEYPYWNTFPDESTKELFHIISDLLSVIVSESHGVFSNLLKFENLLFLRAKTGASKTC